MVNNLKCFITIIYKKKIQDQFLNKIQRATKILIKIAKKSICFQNSADRSNLTTLSYFQKEVGPKLLTEAMASNQKEEGNIISNRM